MYKTIISLAFLTSSVTYAGYEEVKKEINEKISMYEFILNQEKSLYGQWYLGGVITGLENALFVLDIDKEASY